MKQAHKILSICLSVTLGFLPIFSLSDPVSAQENSLLTLDASGQAVPAIPITEELAPAPTAEPSISGNSTDFVAGEGPLSRIEGEEEHGFLESNDPFYSTSGSWGQPYDDLWWLKRVKADQAWAYSKGTNVPVAVIDTGVDYNHEDFNSNSFWTNSAELDGLPGVDDDYNGFIDDVRGWDFYNRDNNPLDDQGHGTHVAGIIGALADNGLGIAGVAPESKIIPIKVLNSQGSGYVTDVINAIRYAANLGALVINLSLGVAKYLLSRSLRTSFESAVAYAKQKGAVVVAAAGNNNGRVENTYPAGIKDVIAVGAIEPVTDNRAWFSNFGKLLDLVAPGVDVLSLKATGVAFGSSSVVNPNYVRASGTSMSSPVIAGVVALIRSGNPLLNFDQILNILRSTATDLGTKGFDSYYGYGLVNALGAVTSAVLSTSISTATESDNSSSQPGKGNASLKSVDAFPGVFLPQPSRPISPVFTPLGWSTASIGKIKKKKSGF